MRLNRGTMLLLVASIVIIVVVLVLNNNQASAPAAETPVDTEGGPLLADLTADQVMSLAVSDNESGSFSRIVRDADDDSLWTVTNSAESAERTVDQTAAAQAIADVVALEADSSFEADNLADFGLDNPAFIIEIDTGETALNTVFVGNENPSGSRYYVITRTLEVASQPDGTPAAPDLSDGSTVFLVNTSAIQKITDLIADPPFLPLPTATPTATATLNPMSEVEMATVTAQAGATATAEMESVLATIAAQPEVTVEVTAEVTEESS